MDISKHICNYLSEHSSVIVPGLGRFIAVNKPSEIRDGVLIPPVRTLEYDSSIDEDDGILTAYIAQEEQIGIDQAKAGMTKFYDHLKGKLAGKKMIMLNKLGTLSVNTVGDIVFKPDANLFIEREDSFGLEKINLQKGTSPEPIAPVPPPVPPVSMETDVSPAKELDVTEGSLFAKENIRVRENTDGRRPVTEKQKQPVKPLGTATAPPPRKQEKKKKTSTGNNGFPMWILLVLLIAGGLGAGFYFLYPKLSPYIDSTISSMRKDKTTISEPPKPSIEENTPNPEVSQTLDDATDQKHALNPASDPSSQPVMQQHNNTQPVTTPVAAGQSTHRTPPVTTAPAQGGIGNGKYLLVVGSFKTQAGAEKFGKSLQEAGISYEIVDFGNERVRVAVGGFDDKTEAFNQANRFKSKPHCENVWVLRR